MKLSELNNNKYLFIYIKYDIEIKLSYWILLEIFLF